MADRRQLAYKDRWLDYERGDMSTVDTDGDTTENELVLPSDDKSYLVLELTGNEYNKLFASASLGADLLYSSEAHSILWLLWKAAKVATFCDAVALCVLNSEAVQNALITTTVNAGYGGGNGSTTTIINQYGDGGYSEPILDDTGCVSDNRFGIARGVVEMLNSATEEVFQAIEILTDPGEIVLEVIDNIPIIGLLAIPFELANWVQNTAFEVYEAAWSDLTRDEIACELFCAMGENCTLSLQDVIDVYLDIEGINPPSWSEPVLTWVEWVMGLPLSIDVDTVKICNLLGLIIIKYGGRFGRWTLGIRSFAQTMLVLADEESDDWEILCSECPETWTHYWNFETNTNAWTDGEFTIPAQAGFYVENEGVYGEDYPTGIDTTHAFSGLVFGSNVDGDATKWTVYCRVVRGEWRQNDEAVLMRANPAAPLTLDQAWIATGNLVFSSNTFVHPVALLASRVKSGQAVKPPADLGSVVCVAVSLEGTGGDPYAGRNTGDRPTGF